jgi:methyl-accepting chemotaxis protein
MEQEERAMARYVNAASDLAEALKENLQHGNKITDNTILKLNAFRIAANNVADIIENIKTVGVKHDN